MEHVEFFMLESTDNGTLHHNILQMFLILPISDNDAEQS
jgi:hypothetical protein